MARANLLLTLTMSEIKTGILPDDYSASRLCSLRHQRFDSLPLRRLQAERLLDAINIVELLPREELHVVQRLRRLAVGGREGL